MKSKDGRFTNRPSFFGGTCFCASHYSNRVCLEEWDARKRIPPRDVGAQRAPLQFVNRRRDVIHRNIGCDARRTDRRCHNETYLLTCEFFVEPE
jgi:hypothetical protein